MSNGPGDPFGGLTTQTTALHEMYESLKASGFTPDEALRLLGEMLAAAGRQT